MKVWNDIVNNCTECNYLRSGLYCKKLDRDLYDEFDDNIFEKSKSIHPDCPFNQKITKEVFSGLGFNQFEDQNVYEKTSDTIIEQLIDEGNNIIYTKHTFPECELLLSFTITTNNPEELKLILNRLGI